MTKRHKIPMSTLLLGCLLAKYSWATLPIYGGSTFDAASGTGLTGAIYWSEFNGFIRFGPYNNTCGLAAISTATDSYYFSPNMTPTTLGNLLTAPYSSTKSYVTSVNKDGWTTGNAYKTNVGFVAARWSPDGSITELPSLEYISYGSVGLGINSAGTIVGGSGSFPVKWKTDGSVSSLPLPPNGVVDIARADFINDFEVALGTFKFKPTTSTTVDTRACYWDANGTPFLLPTLGTNSAGNSMSYPTGLNNSGTMIGVSDKYVNGTNFGVRAVKWNSSGIITELLSGSNYNSTATCINDNGIVAGSAIKVTPSGNTAYFPVRWDNAGDIFDLQTLGLSPTGTTSAGPTDINDGGLITGSCTKYVSGISQGQRAVYWNPDGSVVDLNDVITPGTGWILNRAQSITNNGWITGVGTFDPDGNGPVSGYSRPFSININPSNNWNLVSGGNWTTDGNWFDQITPGAARDVKFNLNGNYTVNIANASTCRNFQVTGDHVTLNLITPLQITGTLKLDNGAKLDIAANGFASGVLKFKNIQIDATSRLDLHDNDLAIDYTGSTTPYAAIVNSVKSGLIILGGNGYGIGSSEVDTQSIPGTFLGVIDNGNISGAITALSGAAVPADAVLIKYTWFGDSNFDGQVDGADYALIDSGFTSGGSLGGWLFGDYDYSGSVSAADYALIDTGFIQQLGVLPEPATTLSLGFFGLLLGRRVLRSRLAS